jgi:hypothetical protein
MPWPSRLRVRRTIGVSPLLQLWPRWRSQGMCVASAEEISARGRAAGTLIFEYAFHHKPSSTKPYSTGGAGEIPSSSAARAKSRGARKLRGWSPVSCYCVAARAIAYSSRARSGSRTQNASLSVVADKGHCSALLSSQATKGVPTSPTCQKTRPIRHLRSPEISATRCFNSFKISKPFDSCEYRSGLALLPVI